MGLVSLKELLVEQKFYLSTMALRVEVSIAIGKQLSTLRIVWKVSKWLHYTVRSQLFQESFVRGHLEGIK